MCVGQKLLCKGSTGAGEGCRQVSFITSLIHRERNCDKSIFSIESSDFSIYAGPHGMAQLPPFALFLDGGPRGDDQPRVRAASPDSTDHQRTVARPGKGAGRAAVSA